MINRKKAYEGGLAMEENFIYFEFSQRDQQFHIMLNKDGHIYD